MVLRSPRNTGLGSGANFGPTHRFRSPIVRKAASSFVALTIGAALASCSGIVSEPGKPPVEPGGMGPGPGGMGPGPGGSTTPPAAGTDPGSVTMHRLNKVEYNNTVADLIGTTLRPADSFQADGRGAGYDNIASALSLSPDQVALYHAAAEALSDAALGAGRAKLVTCDLAMGDACVRTILKNFAKRAWRRPVADADLDRLMAVAATAKAHMDTTEAGLKLAVQAVLVSPNFVFRVELDPNPTSLTPHPLTSHELASRLSYFLWSTMPDDELFAAADAGNLHDKAVLTAQISRMLKHPKAAALVDNFAGQWLLTRQITETQVDATAFPKFDAALRTAMFGETQALFKEIALGGSSTADLLTAKYTFLNDRLANHYGLPAVGGTEMKKVMLTSTNRGGLLAAGSFLTVTSHPTRTSPVNRGKAVLSQLLCTEVPDPPPDVNAMIETSMNGATLREQLESHRANPKCATCHNMMDPLGFGLENYDAVGAYRETDNGKMVDSSGTYLDGQKFSGVAELAKLVSADRRFSDCITTQLYIYALGRETATAAGHMDPRTLFDISAGFSSTGYKFETLVQRLVQADTFLKRRGEPATGGMQ